jgi:hypothetical protein
MPKRKGATNSPELAAYFAKSAQSVNAWLSEWVLLLKAHNVRRVKVMYSAGGDSGQIDDVSFYTEQLATDSEPWRQFEFPQTVTAAFESFAYDILETRGWEVNNEGSQGSFLWDLDMDTLVHNHGTNTTHVDKETFEGIEDLVGQVTPCGPGSGREED